MLITIWPIVWKQVRMLKREKYLEHSWCRRSSLLLSALNLKQYTLVTVHIPSALCEFFQQRNKKIHTNIKRMLDVICMCSRERPTLNFFFSKQYAIPKFKWHQWKLERLSKRKICIWTFKNRQNHQQCKYEERSYFEYNLRILTVPISHCANLIWHLLFRAITHRRAI